jgi:hypothetical protein
MVPVSQLSVWDKVDWGGFWPACVVVCVLGPPWHLTFEQALPDALYVAGPEFALYAGAMMMSIVPVIVLAGANRLADNHGIPSS